MNEQLVSMITQLVMEKMAQSADSQTAKATTTSTAQPLIQFYDKPANSQHSITEPEAVASEPLIKLYQHEQVHTASTSLEQPLPEAAPAQPFQFDTAPLNDSVQAAQTYTPARIGVGRAGTRPKTKTWLKFRLDHAAAVDAVYGEVSEELLQKLNVFQVTTKVTDKEEYITRPDLGRRLSDEAKALIQQKCKQQPTVQIIISNGLSASAIEENVQDVYLALQQSLNNLNINMGTTFYIDKGRVALMDEIGEILQPDVVVYLIGERPGLVSAESMSAYLCYKPRIGTVEAERMVISNIHKGGIPPLEAGAYLGTVVQKILHYQASGVELVAKEG
ncbi:ethanolamine ammonia-lyase subunit EutC [Lysinibacillus macroides]|uniref:Ethanolamine ammonia-lyase small subunit n=1 Tax=Lysinibacillus macroides TaxID=33935 RepID=A0A0N0UW94_9BACI|nr:ethanolamine ammonia-lyase subunit EutC [Lysinibacillus macroides]KOY80815.1 ethanolamine ammonia-lyase [Lysinibacillus macroides]QPR69958.1 ethanolamine ammonia-lyase subunit EutC [Lysinibacillus macroides]